MYGIIYLIIDGTCDKEYVGQTTRTVEERFKEHTKADYYLGKAIRAHGEDLFTWAILKECDSKEELDYWERHMIKSRDTLAPNGYNLTEGGSGGIPCDETRAKISAANTGENNPFFGKHHTLESKAKIGLASKRRKTSDETRVKLSIAHKNPSAATRAKLSAVHKGVPKSPEHRAKIGASNKGKTISKKARAKTSVSRRGDSPYKNLLLEMDARQITYNELANLINLSPVNISRKMCGERNFTKNDVIKLVELFDKPAEYLMARDDGKNSLSTRYETPFKNLLNEMNARHLTYTALGKLLGLVQSNVSLKMRGQVKFTAEQVAKLVEFFNKPAEYLLARD